VLPLLIGQLLADEQVVGGEGGRHQLAWT
jgi:hypothetical protein